MLVSLVLSIKESAWRKQVNLKKAQILAAERFRELEEKQLVDRAAKKKTRMSREQKKREMKRLTREIQKELQGADSTKLK